MYCPGCKLWVVQESPDLVQETEKGASSAPYDAPLSAKPEQLGAVRPELLQHSHSRPVDEKESLALPLENDPQIPDHLLQRKPKEGSSVSLEGVASTPNPAPENSLLDGSGAKSVVAAAKRTVLSKLQEVAPS